MKTYDITMRGYNSETSDTDDLVHWVKSPSLAAIEQFLDNYRLRGLLHDVPTVVYGGEPDLDFEDGVDLVIDENGLVVASAKSGWQERVKAWRQQARAQSA